MIYYDLNEPILLLGLEDDIYSNSTETAKVTRARKGVCLNELHLNKNLSVPGERNVYTHLRAGQMSDVGEPVHVSPAVVKGVNEFVGDNPAHVRLILDIILAQNNLGNTNVGEVDSVPKPAPFLDAVSLVRGHPLNPLSHVPSSPTSGDLSRLNHACRTHPLRMRSYTAPPELTTPVCLGCHSTVVLKRGLGQKQTYLKQSSGSC